MLPQHSVSVRKIFERILAERKVVVKVGKQVIDATDTELICKGGELIAFDEAIWCTQGGAQVLAHI